MNFEQPRKMYPGMWRYPKNPKFCCISRVPSSMREVNPEAYTPQLVLIGPLHHSLKCQALKALDRGEDITYTKSLGYLNMEEHKKTYLAEYAARVECRAASNTLSTALVKGKNTIDGLKRMIEGEEEKIRASYSESTTWIKSSDFVEMVLYDSVFIVEFILRVTEMRPMETGDPLVVEPCLNETVKCDLILLENQLPYFIFEKLFDPIVKRIRQNKRFRELVIDYFGFRGKTGVNSEFKHFTDLIRCVHVKTLPRHGVLRSNPIEHMYNADKLYRGGVKFRAVGDELVLHATFENGCLEMPRLTVDDQLELILRNIMALEQCHYPNNAHVCNYVVFLDYLIDTKKDVDLLVEKGIIQNCIGQPASVARMVNKLGLGILDYGSYYSDIALDVNTYYKNPVNKSKAVLKRVYFGNMWTGTATIAAAILLVMTLIQTWASVTQVTLNKS